MEALTSTEVTGLVTALMAPITANFLMILTILVTVGGLALVYKYVKKGAK